MCEICSELTTKTPERRHSHRYVFIVNFEQISHISGVSIFDFEHVNASWVVYSIGILGNNKGWSTSFELIESN